jgi:YebC/PmpR family DNA-binding regulatory protein
MAGHSKWKNIRHKKEATDQKRSRMFGKLLRAVTLAAQKGDDPAANPSLRAAIERARKESVPQDNIERAVRRPADRGSLEELVLEAYGVGGFALLIIAITDNRNRTIPEIKKVLVDNGGKWAEAGSVAWAFSHLPEEHAWQPTAPRTPSDSEADHLLKLIRALEDNDDVVAVYSTALLSV